VDREIVILVVGTVLCLGVLFWLLVGNEASRLKQQYFLSVGLPRAEAERTLARHLERLQQSHPGKSEAWYLRQVLAELRRDRR
jgi:ABC-type branched-subunit amino acid transport system permease subunit